MIYIFIVIAIIILAVFPKIRCLVFNPVKSLVYAIKDSMTYLYRLRFNQCGYGVIVAYVGLFGKGKTLSAVHKVVSMYEKYNDKKVWCPRRKKYVRQKILVMSNVELKIPYIQLTGLRQIVDFAEKVREADDKAETLSVLLVLGDEFSVQLNSRNFKTNIDPLFLNTILTCRHYRIALYYTSQRFNHVDALLRQVTQSVIVCDKLWRLQGNDYYDAWELENALNPRNIRPLRKTAWFVTNKDYNAYDTYACVGNLQKSMSDGDMLTEQEILEKLGDISPHTEAVSMPSRTRLRNIGVKRK